MKVLVLRMNFVESETVENLDQKFARISVNNSIFRFRDFERIHEFFGCSQKIESFRQKTHELMRKTRVVVGL